MNRCSPPHANLGMYTRRHHKKESVEHLSLELITLNVKSNQAETVRGVRVTVSGTCQVKVDAFTQDDLQQNLPQITLACQHFLGKVSSHFRWQGTTTYGKCRALRSLRVRDLYFDPR